VRAARTRSLDLSFALANAIGESSGEYGGKYSKRTPVVMVSRMPATLLMAATNPSIPIALIMVSARP